MRFFPHYTQLDAMDCGATCLRMIAKYYGKSFSNEFLREKSFITREGVSMLGISDAGESIGFRTQGVKISVEQLKEVPLPCILHWNQNHFVVLYKVKSAKARRVEGTNVIMHEGTKAITHEGTKAITHEGTKAITHECTNDSHIRAFDPSRSYIYDPSRFYISDPAGSKYTLTTKEFVKCWASTVNNGEQTGAALLLEPTPYFYTDPVSESAPVGADLRVCPQTGNSTHAGSAHTEGAHTGAPLRFFFRYLRPFKSQIVQLFIGLFVGSLLSLIFPFLSQAIVDKGIGNNDLPFITLILVSQLVLFVTQLGVEFIRNWLMLHVNTRISISLISDFLAKLMRLPLRFFDSKNVGDIMQRIGDNNRIESFLTGSSLTTLFSFLNFIVFACILIYYSPAIFSVFIVGNVLYVLWITLFLRWRRRLDMARFTQSAAEQSNLVQIVTGMQEIKLNNCEKQQRWKWESIQVKLFKISIKGLALGQYQQIGSVFFTQVTSLLISYLSARAVIEGDMTLGMMMAVSYIIGQLSAPIGQAIGFIQAAQDAKISLERLNEVHNREDEEQTITEKINEIPGADNEIRFENVSFSYDGAMRDFVLEDLNLTIPRNKITAIVGASGSGKTTIVKLLLGFYQPQKGRILFTSPLNPPQGDFGEVQTSSVAIPYSPLRGARGTSSGFGTDLQDINPHLWRQKTGAVMQDGFIFSDTIANNIAVGVDIIDKNKLKKATQTANIEEFINSLPLKYNTKIGMEGKGISQGQRQRFLIARTVYKDPEFLFFDEATNALDANNERVIMENLNDFFENKTVVVVAHRLSTVKNADKIIVLDNGKIVEEGNHTELTAKRGAYYTLVKNQLELGN